MVTRTCLLLASTLQAVQQGEAANLESSLGSASMQQLRASTSMMIKSKSEIMAGMSQDIAAKLVLGMNGTHHQPELLELLQMQFGTKMRRRSRLRATMKREEEEEEEDDEAGEKEHSKSSLLSSSSSQIQAAVALAKAKDNSAKKMLNTMLSETSMKLELKQFSCHNFEEKQLVQMETTRQDVASFNSIAAESRGMVLKAQGNIGMLNIKLTKTREELVEHNQQCEIDISALKASLKIVLADIEVMAGILKLVQCDNLLLMQCAHCNNAVLIQNDHANLQGQLNSLQSKVAQMYTKQGLVSAYHEVTPTVQDQGDLAAMQEESMALAQEVVQHVRHHAHHRADPAQAVPEPDMSVNVSDVPQTPTLEPCIPTTRCTISGSPNCQKLKDRFLVIQAAIVDKKSQLSQELSEKEGYCEATTMKFEGSINGMEEKLKEEQTNLAVATKDQNDAESSSHQKAAQHASLLKEYRSTMKQCCDDTNDLRSEICALEKIRGEVDKLAGTKLWTVDCEVSDWREEECSVTCGGGTKKKNRAVIVHPVGDGMACLPLTAEEACNTQPCPVDCVLEDWGGWSSCSAECGGGLRERSRGIKVAAAHDGDPCEATTDSEACGTQSCDADCILSDWTEWSACSKACNWGKQRRIKSIVEESRGTGFCAEPESWNRLSFKSCNRFSCESLVKRGSDTLKCKSKVDLVLMIDGSGSLGSYGWGKSVRAAKRIINALDAGDDKVKVSVQLFSGPRTWPDYYACTSSDPNKEVDVEKQCGISWVSHFTTDTTALAEKVGKLAWPAASTLTSVALGEAEAELAYGRADANAVVVCITDGWPMSPYNTHNAAQKLKEKASVVWVPVGRNAPIALINQLASLPQSDHVVAVSGFWQLERRWTINKIIANVCPIVER